MTNLPGNRARAAKVELSASPDVADLRDALETIDLETLGHRVRQTRRELGLTQSALAGETISVSYLSRIESGSRRPDIKVLTTLARTLSVTAHDLLLGSNPHQWSALRVELDWAQLSLRTGDAQAALERTTSVLAQVPRHTQLARAALQVHALALEANGRFQLAAEHLEELVDVARDGQEAQLGAMTALCRCYRQAGEVGRAIAIGKRAEQHLVALGLEGTPPAIKLALTLAGAHTDAGDLGYASRLCARALEAAERLGTPFERAGCYWNSSIIASERGLNDEAVELAQQALDVLEDTESARNTARLRTQLGMLYLRLGAPQVDDALAALRRAQGEMDTSDTNPVDRGTNLLAQARAHLLDGDTSAAEECLVAAGGSVGEDTAQLSAEAHLLRGQMHVLRGDDASASQCYGRAIAVLETLGEDRVVAQTWFELAGLCAGVGRTSDALRAFERAGSATGLRGARTVVRTPQPAGLGSATGAAAPAKG